MNSNMTITSVSEPIGITLQAIASPARVAILIAIGRKEACVCHLEAILGLRQAYISQHLMALRKAEILVDRHEGRFVYYRLKDPTILELVRGTARMLGIPQDELERLSNPDPGPDCECPYCSAEESKKECCNQE
jgi:DNA-binding transcriptional ArsR family regulator